MGEDRRSRGQHADLDTWPSEARDKPQALWSALGPGLTCFSPHRQQVLRPMMYTCVRLPWAYSFLVPFYNIVA